MSKQPFDQFINRLIDQAAFSDTLRAIAESAFNISKLAASVDSMLLEEEIATQFDYRGYDNLETQTRTLTKLLFLKDYLASRGVVSTDKDLITIGICHAYVSKGYALTPEVVTNLNDIYKRHGG
jgi:hypothetical protein